MLSKVSLSVMITMIMWIGYGMMWPRTAEATLNVCNRSSSDIWLALAQGGDDKWRSYGWYPLSPNKCESFFGPELKSRYYYGYAFNADGDLWAGEFKFCIHPEINFEIAGDDRCQERFEGAEYRDFFEIDTGDATAFTHELSGFDNSVSVSTPAEGLPAFIDDRIAAAWKRRDYHTVLTQVRPAAEAGRARAINILGLMYLYGYGLPQNHVEGTKWIRQAAELGWSKAQYNLARLLYESPQGKTRVQRVVYWLRQAADQGLVAAQQSLNAIQLSPSN